MIHRAWMLMIFVFSTPLWAQSIELDERIEKFAARVAQSPLSYKLDEAAFKAAWQQAGVDSATIQQLQKSLSAITGPSDSKARYELLEVEEQLRSESSAIVRQVLNQPIQEINNTLLKWMKAYLFSSEQRLAYRMLFDAVSIYKFNEVELKRLERESHTLHQFTQGSLTFGLIATVAAILVPQKSWPKIFRSLTKKSAESSTLLHQAERTAGGQLETVDDALKVFARLNIGPAPTSPAVIATKVSRGRIYNSLSKVSNFYDYKAHLAITGIAVVGGASNIGWNALSNYLFPKNHSNTLFNPEQLRDEFYDGLAVAQLACQTYELEQKTQKATYTQAQDLTRQWNSLFSEFSLLSSMSPNWLQPRLQADGISAAPGKLLVHLKIQGKEEAFELPCTRIKSQAARVDINLQDVLDDLSSSFINIKKVSLSAIEVKP